MSIYLGTTKISGAYTIAKNIGEIFYSQSSSAADNPGGLPLFTGETISNADQLYPQFYNWVLNHPELCTTNSAYETSITNWGLCYYYVINDTNKTIKLPKISSNSRYLIYSYSSGTEWCNIYSDGWCEQGGYYNNTSTSTGIATVTLHREFMHADYSLMRLDNKGTFTNNSATQYIANFTEITPTTASFRVDTNSYILGFKWVAKGYTYVNDFKKKEIYPWVFAYNTAISASVAQASQFQQALSSKADIDLSNITTPHIIETYRNGTEWCRVWSDGWCEQGGRFAGPVNNSSSFTVSFLKDMADTSYTVSFCGTTASTVLTATARYQNSLQFFYSNNANNVSGSDFSWEIKGYTDISTN